jgi:hypothetical protein
MTRAWTKMLLVLCSLLGMTSGFGQDVVLKKLYDGIEDIRLEVKHKHDLPPNEVVNEPFAKTSDRIDKQIGTNVSKACSSAQELAGYGNRYLSLTNAFQGSFTNPKNKQTMYLMAHCELSEGLVIAEKGSAIAAYDLREHPYAMFPVRDINQNGLTEFMLIVQSNAKAPWNEMLAAQLLEFPNGKPVSLGSFFIGGPTRSYTDGGPPEYTTCSPRAPKELRTHFPSNIIYVQKGKVPQFFAEGWEVNCDFLEKGVKARKVSSLTPIKPVPRAVPLTRLF